MNKFLCIQLIIVGLINLTCFQQNNISNRINNGEKIKSVEEIDQVKLNIYNNFVKSIQMKDWDLISKFYTGNNLEKISNGNFEIFNEYLNLNYFSKDDSTLVRQLIKIYCEGIEIGRISNNNEVNELEIISKTNFVSFSAEFTRINVTYANSKASLIEFSRRNQLGVLIENTRCFEKYDIIIKVETLLSSPEFYISENK